VIPEYAALGLPFLFPDIQKAWATLDVNGGMLIH
jgi:TRAP-type C4-dicarboxylate transport system substrate-binding protein